MDVRRSVVIHRPPAEVFAYAADLTRAPEWLAGVAAVHQTSPGPFGPGATIHLDLAALGQRLGVECAVVEYVPGVSAAFEARAAGGAGGGRITCSARPDGTELSFAVSVQVDNPLARLAQGQIGRVAGGQLDASLRQLKRRLEAAP